MNSFYDINDAFIILKQKKNYKLAMLVGGILSLGLIVVLTVLSLHTLVMIFDIILSSLYLGFVYTYLAFIRVELNARYHFLACIDNFEHEFITGEISFIDDSLITVSNVEVYTVKINNRTLFIEGCHLINNPIISVNQKLTLEVVDKYIIGFEVAKDE